MPRPLGPTPALQKPFFLKSHYSQKVLASVMLELHFLYPIARFQPIVAHFPLKKLSPPHMSDSANKRI
jgi:hypothetical protein